MIVGAEAHVTIHAALQMLGLGRERVVRVAADDQGRMRADELAAAVDTVRGPLIVCAQAGNVNTGAFDPLRPIAGAVHDRGGWLTSTGRSACGPLPPRIVGRSWTGSARRTRGPRTTTSGSTSRTTPGW